MLSAETGWSLLGDFSLKDLDSALENEKCENLENIRKREMMKIIRKATPTKTLTKKPIPVKPNEIEETKNQLTIGVGLIVVALIGVGSIAEGIMGVGSIGVGLTFADSVLDKGFEERYEEMS